MSDVEITTDHKPREVIDSWQLTAAERKEFDYLDWPALEDGRDSRSFVRYKGQLYDLGDTEGTPQFAPGWHAYVSDSFFSGVVFRYSDDGEEVTVGTYYAR